MSDWESSPLPALPIQPGRKTRPLIYLLPSLPDQTVLKPLQRARLWITVLGLRMSSRQNQMRRPVLVSNLVLPSQILT
jgi:hypothetical protein